MAFDKLVDSVALEAKLKIVADAIREKAGTSDALAFPAGFAEAIAAIEAGGGGGGKLASGTITPDANATNIQITHNLGVVPHLGVFCKIGGGASSTSVSPEVVATYQEDSITYYTYSIGSNPLTQSFGQGMTTTFANYFLNRANATTVYSPKYLLGGNTYFWLVMG